MKAAGGWQATGGERRMAMATVYSGLSPAEQVEQMQANGGPCLLCNAHTRYVGTFIPDDPVASGFRAVPRGMKRLVFFHLCQRHPIGRPITSELIEKAISRGASR